MFTLVYQIARNRLTQTQQMADVVAVLLDLGELKPYGLTISTDTAAVVGGAIERTIVVVPDVGSTFLTDYPTLALQRSVLTGFYTGRLGIQLASPITALPVS